MTEDKTKTIFLVHGTFARDAAWTKANSTISKLLYKRGVEDGYDVVIKEFIWTGDNSHVARLTAARSLAEKLREETSNNTNVYLICHSHGGTVARKAIDLLEERECPKSVVTFGTPFINFEKKNTYIAYVCAKFLGLIFSLGIPLIILITTYLFPLFEPLDFSENKLFPLIIAFIPFVLLFPLFFKFPNVFRKKLEKSAEALGENYHSDDRNPVPFYCFVTVFDEAGLVLKAWSLITNFFISIQLAMILSLLFFGLVALGLFFLPLLAPDYFRYVYFALFPTLDGNIIFKEGSDGVETWAQVMLFVNLGVFSVLMLFFLLAWPLSLITPWLLRRQKFAFGEEGIFGNIAMNIYVSALPHLNASIIRKYFPWKNLSGKLRHSAFYEDSDTLDEAYQLINCKVNYNSKFKNNIYISRIYLYVFSALIGVIPLYAYHKLYIEYIDTLIMVFLALVTPF